jgi:hypothetical protein
MGLFAAGLFGGGLFLLYRGITSKDVKNATPYAEKFTQYGQPWRSNVNPDLGLNRFHYPDRSLVNTYSKHTEAAFGSRGASTYRRHKLGTSCHNTTQRTNHLVHKRYHNPSQRVTFGHNMPGPSQYAKIGRNQTGQHAYSDAVNPATVLPKGFGNSQNTAALTHLIGSQTNVDVMDEERVTGSDRGSACTVTGGDISEQ